MSESDRKSVLVTGASRGIGREIALRFAKAGYDAAIVYSSDASKDKADEVASLISSCGSKALALKCDVSKSDEVNAMVASVLDAFGKIDVLVNNAGITRDGLLMRMTDQQIDAVLDANLKGVLYVIRACLPAMMKVRNGRIVNLSSIVGLHGNPGQANYSASKAGIIGVTKSIAKEVASRNILVNAVAPGAIDTDMFASLGDKIREAIVGTIPLGRPGTAAEVAEAVLFLASQTYITGQVIQVDGGMGI